MKTMKFIFILLLLGAANVGDVWAYHGHASVGVVIGPYWGPWYYPPSYYYPPYYPPVVVERQAAPVYVERQPVQSAAPPQPTAAAPESYWYYCPAAKGYYPYVKNCPQGWQRVAPQPPGLP